MYSSNIRIKDLPFDDRPREKLKEYGVSFLSNAELIAIIIGTGTIKSSALDVARTLLKEQNGLNGLNSIQVSELIQVDGIGEAKASKIMASIEIGKRLNSFRRNSSKKITCPCDAAYLLMDELKFKNKEYFNIIMLNTKNIVQDIKNISIGSLNSSIVHPREVFLEAIKHSSASIILVHNHPSGDPKPSREDISLTQRLVKAGDILGINVVDHIIIGDECYYSMKEEGLI